MVSEIYISREYEDFWGTAKRLAKRDCKRFPLLKNETEHDRATVHLISMVDMFALQFGDFHVREKVASYIERQLFGTLPAEDKICQLTLSVWKSIKDTILGNEVISGEAKNPY